MKFLSVLQTFHHQSKWAKRFRSVHISNRQTVSGEWPYTLCSCNGPAWRRLICGGRSVATGREIRMDSLSILYVSHKAQLTNNTEPNAHRGIMGTSTPIPSKSEHHLGSHTRQLVRKLGGNPPPMNHQRQHQRNHLYVLPFPRAYATYPVSFSKTFRIPSVIFSFMARFLALFGSLKREPPIFFSMKSRAGEKRM